MRVLYLLGAGASKGAGLKTSAELLAAAREFAGSAQNPRARTAFEALDHVLTKTNPAANIEDLLSLAQALAQRQESDLFLLTSGLREPFLSLEKSEAGLLENLYWALLFFLKDQLSPDPATVRRPYLQKLARLALRSSQPSIYTLNYDLTLETALEVESIPYATGFRLPQGIETTYLREDVEYWPLGYDPKGTRLWGLGDFFENTPTGGKAALRLVKLHGSVDWYRLPTRPVYDGGLRLSPEDRIVRLLAEPEQALPVMIAGRGDKERLAEPFRVLLGGLYSAVKTADVVVVIGYSFSDEHVNRVLADTQVFEKTDSFDLVVVNGPQWPKGEASPPTLSPRACNTWNALVGAGRQSADLEYLTGVAVVPLYAEEAIESGELERVLAEVMEQRRYRGQ